MIKGDKSIAAISHRLCAWYREHQRDLPWRRMRDPYAIWVSEIMLQQTRVTTVIPYFKRWLKLFPTVRALAKAPIEKVLKAWEGLGYYTRARNLHHAAGQVVSEFGGQILSAVDDLRRLKGIGRYTAGAIASIAFGLDEPVLDGNVTRVLCRLFAIGTDPKAASSQAKLWTLARALIPKSRTMGVSPMYGRTLHGRDGRDTHGQDARATAGLFNQAMMDLGATICLPRNPLCPQCPARQNCQAWASGKQDKLPRKSRKPQVPHYDVVVGVIRKGGRLLVDRRPDEGLLGGLWELPGGKIKPGESHAQALRREVKEELGIEIKVGPPLATVRHAYSHFRVTLHAYDCRHISGRPRAIACAAVRWVTPAQLRRLPLPRATQRVLETMECGG